MGSDDIIIQQAEREMDQLYEETKSLRKLIKELEERCSRLDGITVEEVAQIMKDSRKYWRKKVDVSGGIETYYAQIVLDHIRRKRGENDNGRMRKAR